VLTQFVRVLLWSLAVCSLTWLGILWWWQRSRRTVAETDMVIYLGVLPLVTLLLILALRSAWTRAGARATVAPAAAPTGAAAAPVGADQPDADERLRHATVRLVHSAVLSTGGAQASELLQAAADGEPMPVPDKSLVGADGLPVMCARLPDASLALEGCRTRLNALVERLQHDHAPWRTEEPSEGVVRALAALHEPMNSQRQWLLDHAFRIDGADALPQAAPQRVCLILGCAAQWTLFEQALAVQWVESLWAADDDAMRITSVLQTVVVAGTGEDLWLKADHVAHRMPRDEAPDWLLLAAAHSDVDQHAIDVLSAGGLLYDARKAPGGCMPGEAAATALIASAAWSATEDSGIAPVLLHRPAVGLRNKPVEAAGKVDAQVLGQVVGHAAAAARLELSQIAALVCDADQHSPRATELYGVSIGDLPQLDPLEDMRVLGKVTGHVGAASCLMVVACAAESARTLGKPVLAIGIASSRTRLALIVQPLQQDAVAGDSAAANRIS
jgi:hypothetical protein